jgi:hypothetical protein
VSVSGSKSPHSIADEFFELPESSRPTESSFFPLMSSAGVASPVSHAIRLPDRKIEKFLACASPFDRQMRGR